jgi:hypothetical protein
MVADAPTFVPEIFQPLQLAGAATVSVMVVEELAPVLQVRVTVDKAVNVNVVEVLELIDRS